MIGFFRFFPLIPIVKYSISGPKNVTKLYLFIINVAIYVIDILVCKKSHVFDGFLHKFFIGKWHKACSS